MLLEEEFYNHSSDLLTTCLARVLKTHLQAGIPVVMEMQIPAVLGYCDIEGFSVSE